MTTPYHLLGGEDGVRQLAHSFYQAMNDTQEVQDIRHMHSENLAAITEKLFEYLSGWLGGPPLYREKYGTICLTEPHKPYNISSAHRNQWLQCMEIALENIGASKQVKQMLKQPMFDLADFIRTDQ